MLACTVEVVLIHIHTVVEVCISKLTVTSVDEGTYGNQPERYKPWCMIPEREVMLSKHYDQQGHGEEWVQSTAYWNHEQLIDVVQEKQPVAQIWSLENFKIHDHYGKKDRQQGLNR